MKRCAVGFALSLTVLGSAQPLPGDEPSTITWLTMDFPPFFIHRGEHAGEGIADGVTALIQGAMEEWSHRSELADTAEIAGRMRAGDRVCSAAYIRTPEREEIMVFSIPDLVLPPIGLVVRRSDLERFGGGEPTSLDDLLADGSIRLGVARGRSYGSGIDEVLDRHRSSPSVYNRLGEDIFRSLLDLLDRESVDAVLGYPYEAYYVASTSSKARIATVPLVESSAPVVAHVVCPKTPWGRRAIAAVDEAIREVKSRPEYRRAIVRWLGGELDPSYRRELDSMLGGGAGPEG